MSRTRITEEYILIGTAVIVKLILALIAFHHSFYHSDEFLHIDAGHHLAFGFYDFPPIIAILAFLQNLFHSDSLYINRMSALTAGSLIVIFSGLITLKLGGKRPALLIVLAAILFSPGFAGAQILFLPVVFEQLFWIIFIYYMVCYSENSADKYLILAGVIAAIAFLTKYSIVFLIGGFLPAILLIRREIFRNKAFWTGMIIFLIMIAPNIWWQYAHRFPVLTHMSELYRTQLNRNSFLDEQVQMNLFLNPAIAVFWITACFVLPFTRRLGKFRLVSFSLFFAFILLLLAKGKSYYFFPVILGLMPFGAVFFEQLLENKKWISYGYLAFLSLTGLLLLPEGLPVLKLDTYVALYHPKKLGQSRIPLPLDNFYSGPMWAKILGAVKNTYDNLPPDEKDHCLIWGRHYAYAGAMNLLGKKYHLPEAISFHSSYYAWVPEFSRGLTMILIGDVNWTKTNYLRYFDEVQEIAVIDNPYAESDTWAYHTIFLGRKLKYDSDALKRMFRDEIY